MNSNNELTINISGSSNVSVKDIHQNINASENQQLQRELSELIQELATLNIPAADKANISNKLTEAGQALKNNQPKSILSKILCGAGGILKDLAVATGKTFILSLIEDNSK
jgi:uncharacterized membrane protein YcjF (UPF0283 family)